MFCSAFQGHIAKSVYNQYSDRLLREEPHQTTYDIKVMSQLTIKIGFVSLIVDYWENKSFLLLNLLALIQAS